MGGSIRETLSLPHHPAGGGGNALERLKLGTLRLGDGVGPGKLERNSGIFPMGILDLPGGGPKGENGQLSEGSMHPRHGPGLSQQPSCRTPWNQGVMFPVQWHPPHCTDSHSMALEIPSANSMTTLHSPNPPMS